jgi:hypothetical protein
MEWSCSAVRIPSGQDDDLGIVEARRRQPHWHIVAEADGLVWMPKKFRSTVKLLFSS